MKLLYITAREIWDIFEISWVVFMPNITYNHPIICLYYYPQRFLIFKCRYFKLSWNTAALSQSKFRNFSCSSINSLMLLYFAVVWWFCSTQEKISRVLFSILQGKGICYATIYDKERWFIAMQYTCIWWFKCITVWF